MKYSTLRAFEKHLESAAPDHLSNVYLVLSKEAFERKAACTKITECALKNHVKPGQNVLFFDADAVDFSVIWDELQAFSFFAPQKVVVVGQVEKLSKADQEQLKTYFAKPNKSVFLVLEGTTLNKSTNFYKNAEKCGIVLDVAEEKPWEKEKSIQEWILKHVKVLGKHIENSTAATLVKQLGTDQSTIYQELEKLVCFIGDRKDITTADVSAVCNVIPQENAWQLGEAIFRKDASEALRITKSMLDEGVVLIALLRQIRSQFQTDYQVCCMLTNGKSADDIASKYPYMRGNILNKHLQQAQTYGMQRFKAGMLALDETELMAKSSAGDSEWLAERLIFKLATK